MLLLMTTGDIQKVSFVSMDSNQANLLGKYINTFYDSDIYKHELKQSLQNKYFFGEKLKFQFVRVEVNIHYWHTKHHFDISGGWVGLKNFVKMTCCIAM